MLHNIGPGNNVCSDLITYFVLHQRNFFHVCVWFVSVLFVIKAVLFIIPESNVSNYKK